jgi:hypothetical protein
MDAAWDAAKVPLEWIWGRRSGAPLLAVSSNVGNISAPSLDLYNWFLGFPLMHNVENMCGTILCLLSEHFMKDEFKNVANQLSADKAKGHCVASAQNARRALNAAVPHFEEYCTGPMIDKDAVDTVVRKKRKTKIKHVDPLTPAQRRFFSPFLRMATTLVGHIYSRAHPSLDVILGVHVRSHLVYIIIYLLSSLVGMKTKKGVPAWVSKSIYSQDMVAHLGNYLEKFRSPLGFLLEEHLERSFQPMNSVVQQFRTQAVQAQETAFTYFQAQIQSSGLGVAPPTRSALASSFHTYPRVDVFLGWCSLALHPMCTFNIASLLWRLSFSITVVFILNI